MTCVCVCVQDECVAEANDNLNRSGTQLSRVFSSYPTIHLRASSRAFPAFERPFALGMARSLSSSDSKVWHERLPCCKSLKPDIKPIKCHFHGLRQTCTPTVAQFCQAGCNRCEICKQHPQFAMYQDIWREHGKRKIHPCSTQIPPSRLGAYANASIGKNTTSTGIDADPNLSIRGSWTAGGSMNSGGSAPRAMMDSGLMSSSIVSVIRSFEKEERFDLAMSVM